MPHSNFEKFYSYLIPFFAILALAFVALLILQRTQIISSHKNSDGPAQIFKTQEESGVGKPAKNSELTILIGGDVMFDRKIRQIANENGYDSLLAPVAPILKSADISVINLEGPITTYPSETLLADGTKTSKLKFTFDPAAAFALKEARISTVSLANNHTDNFGADGFEQTKRFLSEAGVHYFGDPWNGPATEYVSEINGIKIALVGYNSFQKGFDRILTRVTDLSEKGYFTIVMPHWGNEYVSTSSPFLRDQARTLVAAGAKAIIGSHPHVIMDHEWIAGVPVFYSTGNLLFDQYFSPEVMKGSLIELHLIKNDKTALLDRIRLYTTSLDSRKNVRVVTGPSQID